MRLRVLLFALILGVATPAAQAPDGQITGRLTDKSEGVLPGVRIAVTNGNQSTGAVPDSDGRFGIRLLPMGVYRVVVEESRIIRSSPRRRPVR